MEVTESVSYPVMTGTPMARAAVFNRYIAKRLDLARGMFAASGIKPEPGEEFSIDFQRFYEIHRFDTRLASIEFYEHHEANFGHGWRREYVINWDVVHDRPLVLADLFRDDSNWQQAVEDFAVKYIREDGGYSDDAVELARDGAVADEGAWRFERDGATLLLGHGERSMVGASVEVTIPYDVLAPYLRAGAPLLPDKP
jgi:hypothetical protein